MIHILFLLTPAPLVYHLTGSWPLAWLTALVLAYPAAGLMFKFIEKPLTRQGRVLTQHFAEYPGAKAAISIK